MMTAVFLVLAALGAVVVVGGCILSRHAPPRSPEFDEYFGHHPVPVIHPAEEAELRARTPTQEGY